MISHSMRGDADKVAESIQTIRKEDQSVSGPIWSATDSLEQWLLCCANE